jgi:hypothetical protein
MTGARRRALAGLAFGLVIALGLAEAGLRVAGMFPPPPQTLTPLRPELNRPDPELGYTLKPFLHTTFRYPPGSTRDLSLVSNADGFRNDRDFDDDDPRPRLWVLGDSMTFGEGVEVEDRVTGVIASREPGWRVDNLGMTGWGLDSMVRAYERIARKRRPQAVLLDFYTDDFRRLRPYYAGMGYASLKYEIDDGVLVDVPFPRPPGALRRLRIVQAVEQSYWRIGRNRYPLNEALLDRLRTLTAPQVALAVAFLPGSADTAEDQERRAFLRAWCSRTGTPYADLSETMHARGSAVYIPGSSHWNELGHRVAGEALHAFLRDAKVMP